MNLITESRRLPHAHGGSLVAMLLIAVAAGCDNDGPADPGAPAIATITVTAPQTQLDVGQSVAAVAVARTAAGSTVEASFDWQSSAESVASVSPSGVITAAAEGTATITAAAGGVSGMLDVVVHAGEGGADITAMVESVRAEFGLPAMGGAIVTISDGAWAVGVSGVGRVDRTAPVVIDDKWHLGSNLKAMTSALAAIAVDEGVIAWSTTVSEAFPDLEIHPELRDVTLDELLSQQSGISNSGSFGSGSSAREQRDALVASSLQIQPIVARGTYYYTNMSYIVAGTMLERAWDGVYEELMREKFWAPLGVTGAGWGPTDGGDNDRVTGHTWSNGSWVRCQMCDNQPGLSAAGLAHMPIGDWAKVIQEFLRAATGTSSLISAANGSKIVAPHVAIPAGDTYALGWRVTTRTWGGGTDETITHGGSNIRHHSTAWLGLGTGVAFIATTNAYRASPSPTTLAALNTLIVRMIDHYEAAR